MDLLKASNTQKCEQFAVYIVVEEALVDPEYTGVGRNQSRTETVDDAKHDASDAPTDYVVR